MRRRHGLAEPHRPDRDEGPGEGAAGTSVNGERRVMRLGLGTVAVAAAMAFLVSGCTEGALFPAVHDMPAPRADTPLTPDQVKQATDALTSERDHLTTQALPNGQPATAANAATTARPSTQAANAQSGATQTAGADPKP